MLMKKLKFHPNIVQILGVTFREAKPIVIVELGNETLDAYLLEKAAAGTPASWFEKTMLCLDVSRGIQGLHDAGIVHGDLKGENVLVFIKATGVATAKISDFGYSSTMSLKGTTNLLYSIKASSRLGDIFICYKFRRCRRDSKLHGTRGHRRDIPN